MSFGLDVRVVRTRLPRKDVLLTLPLLPPGARPADDWLDQAMAHIRRQRAPRFIHPVNITIRLEDAHPRRDGVGCIAPVLTALGRCGVLQSGLSHSVRRVTVEWAQVAGVEIRIKQAP